MRWPARWIVNARFRGRVYLLCLRSHIGDELGIGHKDSKLLLSGGRCTKSQVRES